MRNRSREVDAYIVRSEAFARPILNRLRRLFHQACPSIEETIKWGCPHFVHKGIVGSMASFKWHVGLGFWKGRLMGDPHRLFKGVGETSMAALKIAGLSELPQDRVLLGYIEVKAPRPARAKTRKELEVPADLVFALRRNRKARTTFESFSYSNRKDYVEWLTEAKREATRRARLATAIQWMAEGKPRNWKYMTEGRRT